MEAVGLTMAELMPDRSTTTSTTSSTSYRGVKTVVATYDYVDEDGVVLFESVRYDPKGFRQRRPDGGAWRWNLDGVRLVPYRLPELLAGVRDRRTVYLVEGEKDVDRVASLGQVATCNPMGAGKWRQDYADLLRGADVIVVADRDDAGYSHARTVVESLTGIAASVKLLEAASGKDVSDHLDAGYGLDELMPVGNRTDDSWPVLGEAAYQGLAGDVVRALAPTTEAAPVALLVTFLSAAGALIGSKPHAWAADEEHPCRIWPLLVGSTASGRKGSSWSAVRRVIGAAEPLFLTAHFESGLSSGEGLIERVRDSSGGPEEKTYDAGVSDKRLFVVESEFSTVLARAKRESRVLSQTLRQAWDSRGDLRVLNRKGNGLRASGAHIALTGHVTPDELKWRLTDVEIVNGFINRFLLVLVKRSQRLPRGGGAPDEVVRNLGERLADVVASAKNVQRVERTPAADALWCEHIYLELAPDDEREGLVTKAAARAIPYTIRLSVLYALLYGRREVDVEHLEAAIAVWRFARRSIDLIFGGSTGNPDLDKLMAAVDKAGEAGMTKSDI
jgi:5S rRNA maturation endonuclease (ribonuclease M5)